MAEERRVVVLYGSQTGTAQDVAERISREATRRHFSAPAQSLDDYPISRLIHEKLVVFVVATTGQGDPPDNMLKFWRFILRRNLPSNSLQSLQYGVVGLGDSSYLKFNFIGKKLHKRLEQLGARSILSPGLSDEQHDLGQEAVIDPWLTSFWDKTMALYPLPPDKSIIPQDTILPPRFNVRVAENSETEMVIQSSKTGGHSEEHPFHARLLSNDRVTAQDHWQDVRLIRLDLGDSGIGYEAGDVLYIAPENKPEHVEEFLTLLQLDANEMVHVTCNCEGVVPKQLPQPCTWRHLAETYLDICGTPRRYFWELLAQFAPSELEREKFFEFTTAEGQQDLFDYVHRPRRHIVEILADFPAAARNIPKDYILDMIPALQPRAFSIASSLHAHPQEAQLLMGVVRYKSKRLVKPREGVCSTWLSGIDPITDVRIPVWVKKGTIRFPATTNTPVIMVGPGTGVAPFRNFIQERVSRDIGNNVLFFGCRNKEQDYYCEREWQSYVERGLLRVFTAFSRDQEEKVYVQHRIREQGPLLWDLIHNQNAIFCIAGNAKNMPDAVREALSDVIMQEGGKSSQDAEAYLRDMDKNQRYQAETWS